MDGEGMERREVLRRILLGAAALSLGGSLAKAARGADRAAPPARGGKARAVVEIWLAGGPSHLDTFDPKPEAGTDFAGPADRPVATVSDGLRIAALLPLLAKQADKFSLIRGMTHGNNGHETATYIMQTGRAPGERLVYPCFGSVVTALRGDDPGERGLLPPHVVLTAPKGRFSEAGFLGPRGQPFVTGGDPSRTPFVVEGVVAEGISAERQRSRRYLLETLDSLGQAMAGNPAFEAFDRGGEKAYDLILGDAGKLFDLAQEKDAMRDSYGRSRFGQSCLMARRLIESGVPYVTINHGGWDTHKTHFELMRRQLPELDRGLAALLQDLSDRGLLASTIVWCGGEFGRTPRVQWEAPWNGGRGHHGACFTTLVAGGGFRGGQAVGSTDATGEQVRDRPVHPRELHRAMISLLGIDPDAPLPNPRGLDVRVTDPPPPGTADGRLPEIR
jgi:hypothetical protein